MDDSVDCKDVVRTRPWLLHGASFWPRLSTCATRHPPFADATDTELENLLRAFADFACRIGWAFQSCACWCCITTSQLRQHSSVRVSTMTSSFTGDARTQPNFPREFRFDRSLCRSDDPSLLCLKSVWSWTGGKLKLKGSQPGKVSKKQKKQKQSDQTELALAGDADDTSKQATEVRSTDDDMLSALVRVLPIDHDLMPTLHVVTLAVWRQTGRSCTAKRRREDRHADTCRTQV